MRVTTRTIAAEKKFVQRIIELGAVPSWDEWKGMKTPHKIICKNGHTYAPRPDHVMWDGITPCRICVGLDPITAELNYRKLLSSVKATPGWKSWLGMKIPHKVICAKDHTCWPRPDSVQQGQGPCSKCSNKQWNVFYLVINSGDDALKFGITSGNPKRRLYDHARNGYTEVVKIIKSSNALNIEGQLRYILTSNGYIPIRGREYYSIDALSLILDTLKRENY